ncbi:MAG: ADP-ribosylglycohydrolase [Methanoregulaceae archaeon PtaB.Bin152]|nr:MAG: ADP-ribosylglycohydrolase [Methanoregulaceae archaeon PtaB.Bin152]OPY42974.1 MAG: ADP-ribosylglycohydrolase [Methanoregulaceae archaeon PtaU1.Bin222]
MEACSFACSALTHRDPVAGACSSFVNRMVSDMCRGVPKRRAWARALQKCRIEEVAAVLGHFGAYPQVAGLDALLATHAAVSVFMETESFREAVPVAVSLGGDTDTVAAITGALAGSSYGVHTIPESWLSGLSGSGRVWRAAYRLWWAMPG